MDNGFTVNAFRGVHVSAPFKIPALPNPVPAMGLMLVVLVVFSLILRIICALVVLCFAGPDAAVGLFTGIKTEAVVDLLGISAVLAIPIMMEIGAEACLAMALNGCIFFIIGLGLYHVVPPPSYDWSAGIEPLGAGSLLMFLGGAMAVASINAYGRIALKRKKSAEKQQELRRAIRQELEVLR